MSADPRRIFLNFKFWTMQRWRFISRTFKYKYNYDELSHVLFTQDIYNQDLYKFFNACTLMIYENHILTLIYRILFINNNLLN